ncbi:Na+/H+ antiporter NhaC family protein [Virgibacillus proomii]|uniref:Na+/H+ antiporter NhaC family protein n=1 Tax=Virgibacillus proomii TaxID=84407 RepID=UPI0009853A26|nr:Na+/H+ antiporter NhaC family protein [Virgibacillus proomii]
MEGTIYSLIPAVLMLVLVLLTRNVLLSLGTGIVVGAILIHDFGIWEAIKEIVVQFYSLFISDNTLNIGNILLLSFLLLLGIMTAFLQASGGSRAFGDWMIKRVKSRSGAQAMSALLGVIIFIDDYFNSLAVGQIARPLTDRHKISRAKLAYIIDSTSAPVTVVSPISSWGAYIIGTMGGIFAANGVTSLEPLEAFIKMIPFNFYAIGAIISVFLVAYLKMDLGPMQKHETRAMETGDLIGPNKNNVSGDLSDIFTPNKNGRIYHLLVPIAVLIIATVSSMMITGAMAAEGDISILTIFANTNVNLSLFFGGAVAVITCYLFHIRQAGQSNSTVKIILEGMKTMLPAIYILLLAWVIGSIIGELKTGEYLAGIVNNSSLNPAFLPFLFFIIAGFMALATGTSWGTFGIMLPIAVEVTAITDMEMLLPSMAAVLAGAVFGDHCTPISDTTILSSTGAGANHIDHVMTQLPYAILSALAAAVGYLIIGFTSQIVLPLLVTMAIIIGFAILTHFLRTTKAKH